MSNTAIRALFFVGISTSIVAACSPAAWDSDVGGTLPTSGEGGTNDCSGPAKLEAMDPSSLPACCAEGATGEAHCVPKDKVPASYRSAMVECNGGGSCIPDGLIKSGGAKPASCKTTVIGKQLDGACLSICIPKINAKKAFLNKGDCAGGPDIVCAPCISPEDNKSTGACEIGQGKNSGCGDAGAGASEGGSTAGNGCPFEGSLLDVSGFPECDVKGARCVLEAQVTATVKEEQRKMLATCDKGQGPGYCVPEPLLARKGKYTAPTCGSVGGAEGRCLHLSIPFVSARSGFLPQDKCEASERCVPCFDPITGKETGACKIGCDTGPTKPAITFKGCCTDRGKCVPETAIPAALKDRVAVKECAANERCAPTEIATGGSAYKPKACKPSFAATLAGAQTGVCLSDCLAFDGFFEGIAVTQEDCAANEKCAPCSTFSGPTGAPGCPK